MKIISSRWSKDDVGFYILPFVAFSYGEYGNQLWIGWYKYLWTIILHSDVQGSKAYCECGNELLQDTKSKIYETGEQTNIICSYCDLQTSWDLDAPVPLLLTSHPKPTPTPITEDNLK